MFPLNFEHEITLRFRGPNGNQFGEPIPMKIMVVKERNEIEFYKMAIKLHD